ncbi:MAG: inositol monophosphatase family protein [Smithellaceae bacterium]|nr:inositol monophosphatase family protein [Smithellaceae bacterium]
MKELSDFTRYLARKAGKLLAEKFSRHNPVYYKGAIDLVTEADRMSEELILSEIGRRYPGHGVLSEESKERDGRSAMRWIVDPLDGTTNYAHGFPFFCVSIALEKDGDIVLGVVYDPIRDDLFEASLAGGSYLNGTKLCVSSVDDLSRGLLATGFPYDVRESRDNNLDFFAAMIMKAQAIRRPGAAALDLAYLAAGRLDGFWELKLKPWDTAAGCLLVTEAGGVLSDLKGEKWSMFSPGLVAGNGRIHQQMLEVIIKVENSYR